MGNNFNKLAKPQTHCASQAMTEQYFQTIRYPKYYDKYEHISIKGQMNRILSFGGRNSDEIDAKAQFRKFHRNFLKKFLNLMEV